MSNLKNQFFSIVTNRESQVDKPIGRLYDGITEREIIGVSCEFHLIP